MKLREVEWKIRRERRQEAKDLGVPFEPKYNGEGPKTYEEMYGFPRLGRKQSKTIRHFLGNGAKTEVSE